MRPSPLTFFLPALFLACLAPLAAPAVPTPDFVELSARLMPTVVHVSTASSARQGPEPSPQPGRPGDDLFDQFFERFFRGIPETGQQKERRQSRGSGVIISPDGFILTNDHLVSGAEEIEVRLADGRTFAAQVRGLDPDIDLALLKIAGDAKLPVAPLGDSDRLRVGEWVMAIGNPFGLHQTLTVGVVSAKGQVLGNGPYDELIQTDASINPGNSGGPLFNLAGEVVGINIAITADGQGIGFAIPINAVRAVLPQLREEGRVSRGYLGVSVQPVDEELAASFGLKEARGALVADVAAGSPAEDAGIARGDVILAFEGQPVETPDDLPRLVAATAVGSQAKISLWRDGKRRELRVVIGRLEEKPQATPGGDTPSGPAKLGLEIADPSAELARRYKLPPEPRGVVITGVAPGGPARAANLESGDLILELNGRPVASRDEITRRLDEVRKGQVLRLLVQRGDRVFYTTLKAR